MVITGPTHHTNTTRTRQQHLLPILATVTLHQPMLLQHTSPTPMLLQYYFRRQCLHLSQSDFHGRAQSRQLLNDLPIGPPPFLSICLTKQRKLCSHSVTYSMRSTPQMSGRHVYSRRDVRGLLEAPHIWPPRLDSITSSAVTLSLKKR